MAIFAVAQACVWLCGLCVEPNQRKPICEVLDLGISLPGESLFLNQEKGPRGREAGE